MFISQERETLCMLPSYPHVEFLFYFFKIIFSIHYWNWIQLVIIEYFYNIASVVYVLDFGHEASGISAPDQGSNPHSASEGEWAVWEVLSGMLLKWTLLTHNFLTIKIPIFSAPLDGFDKFIPLHIYQYHQ